MTPPLEQSLGSEMAWPGRRRLSTAEQVGVCVAAVALAGYLAMLIVAAEHTEHPVLAGLAMILGLAAVVSLIASAWARRPRHPLIRRLPLRRVPRPARRALARELRAGRPGPPELRSAAVAWACQHLQAPWNPALLLASAPLNSALAAGTPEAISGWKLLVPTVVLAFLSVGLAVAAIRRRAAHRVADVLDQLAAPSPLAERA